MEDFEVCLCNNITRSTIVKAIDEKGLFTLEELQNETKAGTVFGGCIPDIEELLFKLNHHAMQKSRNEKLIG